MVRPKCFYTWFDEEWRVLGKCDRTKDMREVWWTAGHLGMWRTVPSRSFLCPLVFGAKNAPFVQIWGGHLSDEGLTIFREISQSPSCTYHSLESFRLKNSVCHGALFGMFKRYYKSKTDDARVFKERIWWLGASNMVLK